VYCIQPEDLNFADIVNYSFDPTGNIVSHIFGHAIVDYQKKDWKGMETRWPEPKVDDTHTVTSLKGYNIFEVCYPQARYTILQPGMIPPHRYYTVYRYKDCPVGETPEERKLFYEIFDNLNRSDYDVIQLVVIQLKQWGWVPQHWGWLDKKKEKVCSVGAHLGFLNWYYKYAKVLGVRRPLGEQLAETACPADFANHDTFDFIGYLDIFRFPTPEGAVT